MTAGSISYTRGEDPLRADKLNASFSERLLVAGDTMTGPLILSRPPQLPFEAVTKNYIDNLLTVKLLLTVGDTPPANVVPNTFWWHSTECQLYIYYDDGSSQQWVPASTLSALNSYAPLASPVFTGDARAVTPPFGDNDTSIATTAFVTAAVAAGGGGGGGGIGEAPQDSTYYGRINAAWARVAPLDSPAFTSKITLPVWTNAARPASANTGTIAYNSDLPGIEVWTPGLPPAWTRVITLKDAGLSLPVMNGSAAVGTNPSYARSDHVHPVDTSRYAATNPSGFITGNQNITLSGEVSGSGVTAIAVTLSDTTVTPGSYTATNLTIDSKGRITAASNGVGGGGGIADAPSDGSSYGRLNATWAKVLALTSLASTTPPMDGTAAAGTAVTVSRSDHVHPIDTSRYAATNPSGYQTAAQVTAVLPVASSTTPVMDGTAAVGVGTTWARADHVHATDTSRYATANPSGYQTAAQVASAVVASTGAPVAFSVDFSQGAVVVNGAIVLVAKAPFALTINSMDYRVGSAGGSFTVAVQIAGTNVTGLSAVAVSSATSNNAAATAANTVTAGQAITVVISATSGSPTGGNLQINGTR